MDRGEALACLTCRYDVTGLLGGVCPECGSPVDARTVEVARGRAELAQGAGGVLLVMGMSSVATVVVCTVGLLVLSWEPVAALYAFFGLGLAVGGSVLCAAAPVLAARASDRWLVFMAWVRALWCLHLPWLVIPACTLFLALVAAAAKFAEMRVWDLVFFTASVGLVCWLGLLLMVLWMWGGRWFEDLKRLGLDRSTVGGIGVLAALVVLAGAATVGAVGGMAGGMYVLEWFDPDIHF